MIDASGPQTPDPGDQTTRFDRTHLPRALNERYDVLERLGAGGMGVVYKARDRETGATVALKVIHPGIASDPVVVERFKTELLLARQITHKNVCRVYDLNRFDDVVVIAMEYVEGERLRDLIARRGRLPLDEALKILEQLVGALHEAHEQGIVHRDIKPENILITTLGATRLMDFGLARTIQSNATATGVILGTPAYMAPEQAEGRAVDARTDIYALGLVLYEMLTGKAPFSGDTPIAVVLKQIKEAPLPPGKLEPTIPPAVEQAVLKCLEKDPAKRFQRVEDLYTALALSAATPLPRAIPRTRKRMWIAPAVAAVALVAALAVYLWRPTVSIDTPLQQFTLDNGLRVVVVEDHAVPTFSLCVAYGVGSRNEPPGKTGFAHLFEHIMFRGSEKVGPGEHFLIIAGNGGSMNGTTNADRTSYWETLPSNQLDLALFLEADRMRSLAITDANLENQRKVVLEERQQALDRPYGHTEFAVLETVYDGFAYKHPTIGAVADLESATVADLKEFFRLHYAPNNATLTLVGDVKGGEAMTKIRRYFGDIPSQPAAPAIDVTEPQQRGERRKVVEDPFAQAQRLDVVYKTVEAHSPDWYAMNAAATILAFGQSSRLYQKLVKETEVAISVTGGVDERKGPSLVRFMIVVRPGKDPQQIEKLLDQDIDRLARDGLAASDLDRVRAQYRHGRAQDSQSTLNRAVRLGDYASVFGRPDLINTAPRAVDRLSPEEVRRAIGTYLTPARRSVILTIPGARAATAAASTAPAPAEPDRSSSVLARKGLAPVSNDVIRVKLPEPSETVLDNGLALQVITDRRSPIVAVQLAIPGAGALYDPPEQPGVALATAYMARQGTTTKSSRQIAEAVENLGSVLNVATASGSTMTMVTATGPSDTFDQWFEILADVVLNPVFPVDELNGYKQRQKTSLRTQRGTGAFLAAERFADVVFGDHPAHVSAATADAIDRLTVDAVRKWHRETYAPDRAVLSIAGDVSADRVTRLVRDRFQGWARKGRTEPSVPPPARITGTRLHLIDRPHAAQTSLMIGNIGLDRRDPDYIPARVVNQILGSGPTSRLFVNLREQLGYTYGIYSTLEATTYAGPWRIATEVRPDASEDALREILREVRRLRDEPVPQAELDEAKRAIGAGFVLSLENIAQRMQYAAQTKTYGFSSDYWNTFPAKIMEVTAADVQRVAQKYLDPDALAIVAVGDRQRLEPILLKRGPVAVWDADGRPIK